MIAIRDRLSAINWAYYKKAIIFEYRFLLKTRSLGTVVFHKIAPGKRRGNNICFQVFSPGQRRGVLKVKARNANFSKFQ